MFLIFSRSSMQTLLAVESSFPFFRRSAAAEAAAEFNRASAPAQRVAGWGASRASFWRYFAPWHKQTDLPTVNEELEDIGDDPNGAIMAMR